jgi:hypothetical protein
LQVILKATFSVYIQPFAVKKKILKIPNAKSKKDRQQHGEKEKEKQPSDDTIGLSPGDSRVTVLGEPSSIHSKAIPILFGI